MTNTVPFWGRYVPLPLGLTNRQLALREIDVPPLEGHLLAATQASVTPKENRQKALLGILPSRFDEPLKLIEVVKKGIPFRHLEQLDRTSPPLDEFPTLSSLQSGAENRQHVVDGLRRSGSPYCVEETHQGWNIRSMSPGAPPLKM